MLTFAHHCGCVTVGKANSPSLPDVRRRARSARWKIVTSAIEVTAIQYSTDSTTLGRSTDVVTFSELLLVLLRLLRQRGD